MGRSRRDRLMMPMPRHSPRRTALTALALCAALVGCETVEDLFESNWLPDAGYEKVAARSRDEIPRPARPDPPPAVALAGTGAAEVPVLAAAATPPGVSQEMVEQGAQLYRTSCSACHGPAGTGTPAAPALNDAAWLNISGGYDEIVSIIHAGVPSPREFPAPMPPLGGGNFDDDQVRAIAAYVLALSNPEAP